MTKPSLRAPGGLELAEFSARLKELKDLRDNARNALKGAAAHILTFAEAYVVFSEAVKDSPDGQERIDRELGIEKYQATRLRGIVENIKRLRPIENRLPPALENIYQVTLLPEKDFRDAKNEITTTTTLKEIRDFKSASRKRANGKTKEKTDAPQWTVTVIFKTRESAAKTTARFLEHHKDISIRVPNPTLRDDITEEVSQDNAERISK
jgi:hypothetical protein